MADFFSSFKMLYKTKDEWIDRLLSVTIEEVGDELAARKLNQNPEKWSITDEGNRLLQEDALVLVKTSIVIDIETIIDFEVTSKATFVVGIVANSAAE